MPVSGPFARLAQHAKAMAQMAQGAILKRESGLMEEARANLQDTTQECFFLQRAPDGTPWAERKTVYGGYRDTNPILFNLLESIRFEVVYGSTGAMLRRAGSSVRAFIPAGDPRADYWLYHQRGTPNMAARPFLITSGVAPPGLRDKMLLAGVKAARRVHAGAGAFGAAVQLARGGFLG